MFFVFFFFAVNMYIFSRVLYFQNIQNEPQADTRRAVDIYVPALALFHVVVRPSCGWLHLLASCWVDWKWDWVSIIIWLLPTMILKTLNQKSMGFPQKLLFYSLWIWLFKLHLFHTGQTNPASKWWMKPPKFLLQSVRFPASLLSVTALNLLHSYPGAAGSDRGFQMWPCLFSMSCMLNKTVMRSEPGCQTQLDLGLGPVS